MTIKLAPDVEAAARRFDRLGFLDEGWLDTAARLERERGLTAEERRDAEVLMEAFGVALRDFGIAGAAAGKQLGAVVAAGKSQGAA